MDDTFPTLPKSMAERALFAREAVISQPDSTQFDDNMLLWAPCEEDGLWYSLLGNYSASSPIEKRAKEADRSALVAIKK